MAAQAKEIIAEWRKKINSYRKLAKRHVREYIEIMEKSTDNEKERLIDSFGKFKISNTLQRITLYSEAFNQLAEKDLNQAIFALDDYCSKVDQKMNDVSSKFS